MTAHTEQPSAACSLDSAPVAFAQLCFFPTRQPHRLGHREKRQSGRPKQTLRGRGSRFGTSCLSGPRFGAAEACIASNSGRKNAFSEMQAVVGVAIDTMSYLSRRHKLESRKPTRSTIRTKTHARRHMALLD